MPIRNVVTAPPVQPPRYGLVASARVVPEPDEHWIGGFSWDPEACGNGGVVEVCGDNTTLPDSTNDAGVRHYDPFVVFGEDECTTKSGRRDRDGRARRVLEACQSRQIEKEFWTGALLKASGVAGQVVERAYLTNEDDVDVLAADPVAIRDSFAALEEARGNCSCGGRAMIHATIQTVTLLRSLDLVRREGNLILSVLDTIVVPGAGYDGSDPAGDVDGTGATAWMYGTSMVDVRLSSVDLTNDTERLVNTTTVRAQRAAAATFDPCCLYGINVDLAVRG